jgi:hypothetical protein
MRIFFRYKTFSGTVALLFLFPWSGACQQQSPSECQELHEDDTPGTMLKYLQQDRLTLPYSCIEMAMRALGEAKYKPAIKTLIEYLDLKEPGLQHMVRPGQPTGGLYPAAVALGRIGDSAIPDLKRAISNEDNSKVVRVNAARTYLSIVHDEPPAISFVAKAARGSLDQEAGKALMDVAKIFAEGCREQDRERCQEALE